MRRIESRAEDTVASILLDAENQDGDRNALHLEEGVLSFGDVALRSRQLASHLSEAGVRRGDRVALLLWNGQAFVIAHYALALLGATIVPINPMLGGRMVCHVVERCSAVCLISTEALIADLPDLDRVTSQLEALVLVEDRDSHLWLRRGPSGTDDEPVALEQLEPREAPPQASAEDPALLFFTSGTTGTPKGVLLTHKQALFGIDAWATRWSFHEGTISLMAAPYFHVVYNPLVLGAHRRRGATVVQSNLSIRAVTVAIERYGVTALMGTPALMMQLATDRWAKRNDLSSLDTIIYGAAPTPTPVIRSLAAHFPGRARYNCYGLTETSSALTCLGDPEIDGREASVGPPHPGVEIKIVDTEGQDLPTGAVGEVCAHGPNVISGYFEAPQIDAERFFGNWLRTGDLGYLDEEGFLYLLDRADDLINVAGEKFYPCQIEEVLFSDSAVAEAAAVGVQHPRKGKVVHAFVVPRSNDVIDVEALRKRCIEQLAACIVPRRITVLEQIPRNPTGKILRRELLSLAKDDRLQGYAERDDSPGVDEAVR
jgi:acyl-CoA synthetase (AMP-forming)/AMP-acid ligase II